VALKRRDALRLLTVAFGEHRPCAAEHADCFGAFDPKAKSGKADGDSIADGGRPYVQRDPPKPLHVAELVYLLTSGQPPSASGRNASSAGMAARTLK